MTELSGSAVILGLPEINIQVVVIPNKYGRYHNTDAYLFRINKTFALKIVGSRAMYHHSS